MHLGQHSPGNNVSNSILLHDITGHSIPLQSGLQNGSPKVEHIFLVHIALPFESQLQSLHPSLNPFGHVSQPTNNTSILYLDNNINILFT